MGWIENIRAKSHKEKVKTIYIICGIVAGLMIILWILTTQIGDQGPADTTIFRTIKQGVNNWRAN